MKNRILRFADKALWWIHDKINDLHLWNHGYKRIGDGRYENVRTIHGKTYTHRFHDQKSALADMRKRLNAIPD